MTAMRAAFERAGYPGAREEWPSDELLNIGINAMIRHASDTEATQHAIFRACRNDPVLLRQLLLPWWRQATASLISEAKRVISRRDAHGELENARDRRAAKIVALEEQRERRQWERERREDEARQAEADRKWREENARWMATRAASVTIDDQPFWQASTRRAREWQRQTERQSRFMDLLLTGVPEDERPVACYRRPDEVDAIWRQSGEA